MKFSKPRYIKNSNIPQHSSTFPFSSQLLLARGKIQTNRRGRFRLRRAGQQLIRRQVLLPKWQGRDDGQHPGIREPGRAEDDFRNRETHHGETRGHETHERPYFRLPGRQLPSAAQVSHELPARFRPAHEAPQKRGKFRRQFDAGIFAVLRIGPPRQLFRFRELRNGEATLRVRMDAGLRIFGQGECPANDDCEAESRVLLAEVCTEIIDVQGVMAWWIVVMEIRVMIRSCVARAAISIAVH